MHCDSTESNLTFTHAYSAHPHISQEPIPEMRGQLLKITHFLPNVLGALMVYAGGCSGLTLGIMTGHKEQNNPLVVYGPGLLRPSR